MQIKLNNKNFTLTNVFGTYKKINTTATVTEEQMIGFVANTLNEEVNTVKNVFTFSAVNKISNGNVTIWAEMIDNNTLNFLGSI